MREIEPRNRLIVALDRSQRDELLKMADVLHGVAGWLKIGLQAFVANGPSIVSEVRSRGIRVFLDLKFHDIPNTASNAVREALASGAEMTNVHASGGAAMLRACAAENRGDALLIAVTVLTSLDAEELAAVGYSGDVASNVVRLARLSRQCGLSGVVASPNEITAIREACGDEFVIVTPGIRSATDLADDQKRTLSARDAITRGADYIVVGRPITGSDSPRDAAQRIVEQITF